MYRVLMFGTGRCSEYVESILNNDVKNICYIDNDSSKWGHKKNGLDILSPDSIQSLNYEYIIIASQYNDAIYDQLIGMGIAESKVFQYYKFIDNSINYYRNNIDAFVNENIYSDTELLNTGISYSWTGFRPQVCCKKSYNFAYGSQDLYYDYNTVKYLLDNFPDRISKVKYTIIGLSYYSFQYDMSLSSMKGKVVLYYDVIKKAHHFKDIDKVHKEYDINKTIADKIFRKKSDGSYDFKWEVPYLNNYDDKWIIGKKQAYMDCDKNYPETVKENVQIFKDYLSLLINHNIKPIVVVYPASKYYTENFSIRLEEEFHFIINEIRKKYNFQYINYFRTDLFNDDDFGDVSHLNFIGAEKFTKILNKIIRW